MSENNEIDWHAAARRQHKYLTGKLVDAWQSTGAEATEDVRRMMGDIANALSTTDQDLFASELHKLRVRQDTNKQDIRPIADLLSEATSMLGPLLPETRERIINAIADPGPETWDDAHSIIVNGGVGLGRTLWQAVIRVDPTFPTSAAAAPAGVTLDPAEKWERTPDPLTILRALHNALDRS